MQKPIGVNLVETLKLNNFYLMTNENEKEVYDDDGNLLLYQAETGNYMAVPNTEEVRRLYDLPLESPEIRDTINKEDISKSGGFVPVQSVTNKIVWMGHKTEHSIKATKALIQLYDSPKYQTLMNNPRTVKLKVWEQIATEMEQKGFKIASNTREAGLRVFQKWRNMERTYLKYIKSNGDSEEEHNRRKPYFFDDFHVVMSKNSKESSLECSDCPLRNEGELINENDDDDGIRDQEEDDGDYEMEDDSRTESGPPKRRRISDLYGTEYEAFPRQALNLLTSLVTSPKYEECLYANFHKLLPSKTKVWESIYSDMVRAGWKFGTTVREGAVILSEKWRMVEKTILRKRLCGPRTLYTPALRRAVLMEIEKRKALGPNYTSPPSPPDVTYYNNRKPKGGEIEPEVIETLVKIVGSGHFQNLFAASGGKRSRIWEKIYEEIESKGFQIAGGTKEQKVTRLFQKWRNMKRAFVKYQIAKSKGRDVKKPMFYEMMFQIISHDVMKMHNLDHDAEAKMEEEWDEESESECLPDPLELSQTDHDYGQPTEINEMIAQLPSNISPEKKIPSFEHVSLPVQSSSSRPSSSRTSKSHEVLKQIKSLYETSLAVQQQNFTKIISLLENQISQQHKLTSVISEYITSQANNSKQKHSQSQRTENVSRNNTSNGRRSTLKDENFLS